MGKKDPVPAPNILEEEFDRDVRIVEEDVHSGRIQRSIAVISGFAAVISGFEACTQHQRGHFSKRWMWTPVWFTPLTAIASGIALFSQQAAKTLLPFTVKLAHSLIPRLDPGYGTAGIFAA